MRSTARGGAGLGARGPSGRFFMMAGCAGALRLPIGVAASIYLEEFAPEEPVHRCGRGEYLQTSRRCLPSCLRYLGPRRCSFSSCGPAVNPRRLVGGLVLTLMTLADDHHFHPCVAEVRSAVASATRPLGVGASKDAIGVPPRAAACRYAGHS